MSPRFQSNRLGLSSSSDYISQSNIMTSHFKKRALWYLCTDNHVPSAFLLWFMVLWFICSQGAECTRRKCPFSLGEFEHWCRRKCHWSQELYGQRYAKKRHWPRSETHFFLCCVVTTYSVGNWQNEWWMQQGLKLQRPLSFLLCTAELLKAQDDGSRFSCLTWPLVWWHTAGNSRLPRRQSTWKPRGCPCAAAGHVTWQALEPCAHSRLFK